MFDDLMKIIESKEYDTNLRQCLEKASPDYMTSIAKRKKDIMRSDHGIVVAGETSAGKSTLINKILEMRIFKGRNMESTSTVCKLRNSDKVVIKTESENGEVERIDMSDIDVLTKEGEKTLRDTLKNLTDMTIEKGSRKYKSVDIGLPLSFLKGNTIMVDAPGIGGSGKVSQKLMEYLPNAVSFIFVINIASAGGMQRDRVYQKETATLEFNQFRRCLEKMVMENENIRTTEHFRYLYTLLDDVCTGVRTRQELVKKSKDEQEKKRKEHQMQIDSLREKCKTKSHCWRKRIKSFIEQEAKDSFEYMSSDNGKERILNPKGWDPIMEVTYVPTTLGDDVQARIDHYINERVRSPEVIEEFKNIKDDILEFYKEISFEIEKIENAWTGTVDVSYSKREISYKEESVAPYVAGIIATSPIWFPLLAAGVAIAVASVPFAAPIIAFLGRDSRKKKLIDKEYDKCKLTFRSHICNSMESNHGDALNKLISKITDVILQRRIKFIEETIKELSENRERIIANQKKLISLAEKLKSMKDVAEEIKHALNNWSTE
ncbi:uncharacterized protein LOC134239723 isoform X2 [Saccostrea cucullata]|uniref:uncharacterized protein LOC134239723 isoform X2 n=1 Tax=Saccostrea cuccullata TaxID=36930 RepID=UPI002ED0A2F7